MKFGHKITGYAKVLFHEWVTVCEKAAGIMRKPAEWNAVHSNWSTHPSYRPKPLEASTTIKCRNTNQSSQDLPILSLVLSASSLVPRLKVGKPGKEAIVCLNKGRTRLMGLISWPQPSPNELGHLSGANHDARVYFIMTSWSDTRTSTKSCNQWSLQCMHFHTAELA